MEEPQHIHRAPWEPTTGPKATRAPHGDPDAASHAANGPRRSAPEDFAALLGDAEQECVPWCPICRSADVVRATTSPELREQFNQIQREALVTVRALLDHYLERLDEQPRRTRPVEDIPIE
jgi:hypothetical protein